MGESLGEGDEVAGGVLGECVLLVESEVGECPVEGVAYQGTCCGLGLVVEGGLEEGAYVSLECEDGEVGHVFGFAYFYGKYINRWQIYRVCRSSPMMRGIWLVAYSWR